MVNSELYNSNGEQNLQMHMQLNATTNCITNNNSTQSTSPITAVSASFNNKNDIPIPTKTEFNSSLLLNDDTLVEREIGLKYGEEEEEKEEEEKEEEEVEEVGNEAASNDGEDADGKAASLYCSVPLDKVQMVLSTYKPLINDKIKTNNRKLLCLYCERTFVNANLKQKHIERCHSTKQNRRLSTRINNNNQNLNITNTICLYCEKFTNNTEHTLEQLFQHLIMNHSNKYFGCLPCQERFLNQTLLKNHNASHHSNTRKSENLIIHTQKFDKINRNKDEENERLNDEDEIPIKVTRSKTKLEQQDKRELRNRRLGVKTSKIAIKRSKRLQAKILDKNKRRTKNSLNNDNEILNSTNKLIEKRIVPNNINPYPEFDCFFRVKKITDHSIDNLKISSLTFDDVVFDKAFFNRIKCNIQENLLNFIDGKLFNNEESENRISNFEKIIQDSHIPNINTNNIQTNINNTENYGCELSLNAVTPTVTLLTSTAQFGEDFESQIEYGSKPSTQTKKKTQSKSDEINYKYFTRRKYQASILEQKENRDLSKLDMWTQLIIKNRQQLIINEKKTPKEIIDYKTSDEYKSQLKRDELNRILDRRGPFEDLKQEATKMAQLNSFKNINNDKDNLNEIKELLNELLNEINVPKIDLIINDNKQEIPSYLNLKRRQSNNDNTNGSDEIDRSDKIALICSSQETEYLELPTNSVRNKNEKIELTGEWARSRIYICAACGLKLANLKQLLEHKSVYHQNVWVQQYEFVGNQSELYRHLSIPGLGKVGVIEQQQQCKLWKRSDARLCTKCNKQCNSLGELHRHILECGGDWTWMLARKKCKYRPFGAKSRRKRRGLVKRRIFTQKTEPSEKKTYKKPFDGPRPRPSDADTIQRMLANLPPKRATRKIMCLKDGFPRRKNLNQEQVNQSEKQEDTTDNQVKLKCGKLIHKRTSVTKPINNEINENKSQKTNFKSNRRSLRSFNKVLASRILDTNTNLIVKRKFKKHFSNLDENNKETLNQTTIKTQQTKQKSINENEIKPKRNSPRIESKLINTDGKIATKTISDKMNIKRFFSIRKKLKKDTKNNAENKIRTYKRKLNDESNENNINESTIMKKKTKKETFSNLVRTLSFRRKKIKTESKNYVDNEPSTSSQIDENLQTNKRKLRNSFRRVVRKLKKLKPTNDLVNNEKSDFLDENNRKTDNVPKIPDLEKIVIPLIPEENKIIDTVIPTVPVPVIVNFSLNETPPIFPATIFDLQTKNEKILQAKCDENFNDQIVKTKIPINLTTTNKGKIRKPTRGLNDCIAMLTSKLNTNIKESTIDSIFNLASQTNVIGEEMQFPIEKDPTKIEEIEEIKENKELKEDSDKIIEKCILKIPQFEPKLYENELNDKNKETINNWNSVNDIIEDVVFGRDILNKINGTLEQNKVEFRKIGSIRKRRSKKIVENRLNEGFIEETIKPLINNPTIRKIGQKRNKLKGSEEAKTKIEEVEKNKENALYLETNIDNLLATNEVNVNNSSKKENFVNEDEPLLLENKIITNEEEKSKNKSDSEDEVPLATFVKTDEKQDIKNTDEKREEIANEKQDDFKKIIEVKDKCKRRIRKSKQIKSLQSEKLTEDNTKKIKRRYNQKKSVNLKIEPNKRALRDRSRKNEKIEVNNKDEENKNAKIVKENNIDYCENNEICEESENSELVEESENCKVVTESKSEITKTRIAEIEEKQEDSGIYDFIFEDNETKDKNDKDVYWSKMKEYDFNSDSNLIEDEQKVVTKKRGRKSKKNKEDLIITDQRVENECNNEIDVLKLENEVKSDEKLEIILENNVDIKENFEENETVINRRKRNAKSKALENIFDDALLELTESERNREISVKENNEITKNVSKKTRKLKKSKIAGNNDNTNVEIKGEKIDKNNGISESNVEMFNTVSENVKTLEKLEINLLETLNEIEHKDNNEVVEVTKTVVKRGRKIKNAKNVEIEEKSLEINTEIEDTNEKTEEINEIATNKISEDIYKFEDSNGDEIKINSHELRRSRRNSRKKTSYNEHEFVDPLLDDVVINGKKISNENLDILDKLDIIQTDNIVITTTTNSDNEDVEFKPTKRTKNNRKKLNNTNNIKKVNSSNTNNYNCKKEITKKLNSDELFDLLKATPSENSIVLTKPTTNLFFNNFDDDDDDNDNNFNDSFDVFDNIEKSIAVIEENLAEKSILDVDLTLKAQNLIETIKEPKINTKDENSEMDTKDEKLLESNPKTEDLNELVLNNEENSVSLDNVINKKKENDKSIYCEICNKSFRRLDNLTKHKRTLTHISKLSEIEAKEAEKIKKDDDSELEQQFETSPSLKLADIINDVLNKPVLERDNKHFSDIIMQNDVQTTEFRRYKSLGERKSFEEENPKSQTITHDYFEPQLSKTTGTILEKQISLLENMIENRSNLNYIDDISLSSNNSIIDNKNEFIKPVEQQQQQYEEISEDSTNLRNYDEQKSRKVLNRDEELFLECCSLLKSSSKSSNHQLIKNNNVELMRTIDESDWMENKNFIKSDDKDNFNDNSRIPTPFVNNFIITNNEESSNDNWNENFNDNSQSEKSFTFEEVFNNDEEEKNKQKRSRFAGISNVIKNKFAVISKTIKRNRSFSEESTISNCTIEDENKKKSDDSDASSNTTTDSKKMLTKGAMKIFEGLKVSIPTEELNLTNVLNKKIINNNSRKKQIKKKKLKMSDIYDFEETQDNSDVLFPKPHFRNFRTTKQNDESENDSLDNFTQSSTSSLSDQSIKKKTDNNDDKNITKKKCMIMGRIFKNAASKSKENNDNLGISEDCNKEKSTKMTQEELNLVFNKLLQENDNDQELKKPVNLSNKKKLKTHIINNKKRNRLSSDSTDDEFNINNNNNNKTKKRIYNRKNTKDNCINLEQELKECIGVASRKSQRKCTSGKQNILVEYWSSDESAFEALLENNAINEPITKEEEKIEEIIEKPKIVQKKEKKNNLQETMTNRRKRTAANPLYHWSSSSEDETNDLIEVKPIRDLDYDDYDDDERPIQHGWIVGDSPKKLVTMLAQAKGKKCDVDGVKEQSGNRKKTFS